MTTTDARRSRHALGLRRRRRRHRGPGVPGRRCAVAAIASLGAGAIHATAAGAHSEHRGVVIAFAVTAVAADRLGRPGARAARAGWSAWSGAAVNAGALGGWVVAKTTGIGFIEGLDTKESAQFADSLAAGLAARGRRRRPARARRPQLVGAAARARLWSGSRRSPPSRSRAGHGQHGQPQPRRRRRPPRAATAARRRARPRRHGGGRARPSPTTPPCRSTSGACPA